MSSWDTFFVLGLGSIVAGLQLVLLAVRKSKIMSTKQSGSFDLSFDDNRMVFEYVRTKATHDDLVEVLIDAVKPLGDAQISCPGAVVASTKGIIFAFGMGTGTMAFRLDNTMRERAIVTGGRFFPDCGPTWVSFNPFRGDWPKIDFEFWARKAYSNIRENLPG